MQILLLFTLLFSGSHTLIPIESVNQNCEVPFSYCNMVTLEMAPDSNLYEIYESRGIENFDTEKYEEAILDFRKALELEPKNSYCSHFLGLSYYRLKEFKKSIEVFDKMIDADSTDYITYNNRAEIYRDMGELIKASADIKKALSMEKEDGYIYATIAMIHADLGQIELFYENIEKAIKTVVGYPLNEKTKEKKTLQKFKSEKRFQELLKTSYK